MYELTHPECRAKTTFQEFADRRQRYRQWAGEFLGFEVGDSLIGGLFHLVVDTPANFPDSRRGARPSLVRGEAGWVREGGKWRLWVPPWQWAVVALRSGEKQARPRLTAPPRSEGSVWSSKTEPVPEFIDPQGLETALEQLLEALADRDNAAVYELLSAEARSKMPFTEYDEAMRKLQEDWLKPISVYSVERPHLGVSATLDLKPTPERRKRLEQIRGHDLGEIVRYPYGLALCIDDGEWYVWRR